MGVAISSGAAIGIGVYLLVAHLLVADHVSLSDALRPRPVATAVAEQSPQRSWGARAQDAITHRLEGLVWLRSPDTDLALIDWSRGRYVYTRVVGAVAVLLAGPVLAAGWVVIGSGLPPSVPVGIGFVGAVFTWLAVGMWVRDQAAARRGEMRQALVSYLTILALYLAAGEGRQAAMTHAARVSQAWTFRRIDARIATSIRAGRPPEAGLGDLATELGVDEIADTAGIIHTASTQGAQVFETLLARANGLRQQLLTEAQAVEAARTIKTALPKTMLMFATLAFLLYPAVITITN